MFTSLEPSLMHIYCSYIFHDSQIEQQTLRSLSHDQNQSHNNIIRPAGQSVQFSSVKSNFRKSVNRNIIFSAIYQKAHEAYEKLKLQLIGPHRS